MASAKLTRTNGTATTGNIYTWSAWVKRGAVGSQETLVRTRTDDNNYSRIRFDSDDTLLFEDRISSSTVTNLISSAKFRDMSAWYHIVVRVDYTQATAGDRARIYVNGSEVTYSTTTRQSQNGSSYFNSANSHDLGHYNSNNYFAGSMTHVHFTDGYSYAPSTFGETDSTSGIWKPKTSPSVTYGNNGYFLKMENSSDMGEDSSGNNNDFTTSGTITQTEDTPSNNFATLNPLIYITGNSTTLSNGNTTVTSSGASHKNAFSSLGVSSGKWYCEIEVDTLNTHQKIGVASDDNVEINKTSPSEFSGNANGYAYRNDGQIEGGGGSISSYGNSYTNGDIIGIAMDLDNNKLYFSKNGTFQNSGDPTSGATGTGAAFNLSSDKTYFIAINHYNSNVSDFNFGNGRFGTTALASSNSDSAGLGLFEYSVPSGYYALCTKNIKNYG